MKVSYIQFISVLKKLDVYNLVLKNHRKEYTLDKIQFKRLIEGYLKQDICPLIQTQIFTWSSTDEGRIFWQTIHTNICNILNLDRMKCV